MQHHIVGEFAQYLRLTLERGETCCIAIDRSGMPKVTTVEGQDTPVVQEATLAHFKTAPGGQYVLRW